MQTSNHPILPAIEEFLKIPCKDLALLIDGAWGSGKTFFLRNLFKEEWHGKKIIYISLKGISSLDDISQEVSLQIAMCKLPEKEKLSKYLSKFPILSALKNVDIPYLNTSGLVQCLNKGIISGTDLMKYIFIFDDLERLPSHITYKDALFYIHSLLLEGRFANVIVVTDKKHLFEGSNNSSEEYKQIANKVFYRELPFNQNIKDIFACYLRTRYPNIPNFLSTSLLASSIMQEIFEKNTTQNLRYYNQFFDAFFAIWPYFDKINFPSKEIKQNVLNEILVRLWYEYIFLQVTPPSAEKDFVYPFTGFSIFPYEYKFIHQFFEKGILEEEQMKKEICGRFSYYTQRAPIDKALSTLNNFSDYQYDEVELALESVLSVYLSLSDIKLLIDIYRCFVFLNHVGLITNTLHRELVSKIRSHIRRIVFDATDINLLNRTQVNHLLYAADKEIYNFWDKLYNDYQKHLEKYYIDLFLKRDFTHPALLYYCESMTPQRMNVFWKSLFLNKDKLAKEKNFAGFIQFMMKHIRHLDIKPQEANAFIKIYLAYSKIPSEVELLRQWILQFVAKWDSANYKKYAGMLRKRNLILSRRMRKTSL